MVYISPLKALINDQWARLELLCEKLDIMVTPWHGDISISKKKRFIKQAIRLCTDYSGIVRGDVYEIWTNQVGGIFSSLAYVVVDEVHSFMGTERGKQLQSLLHRLDVATGQKVPQSWVYPQQSEI